MNVSVTHVTYKGLGNRDLKEELEQTELSLLPCSQRYIPPIVYRENDKRPYIISCEECPQRIGRCPGYFFAEINEETLDDAITRWNSIAKNKHSL